MTTNFPQGSYAFAVALQPDGKIIAAGTDFVDFILGEPSDTDSRWPNTPGWNPGYHIWQ